MRAPQSGVEKITVNVVNNDHGMRDTMIRVIGSWEAESKDEHGVVPVVWNLYSRSHWGDFAHHRC